MGKIFLLILALILLIEGCVAIRWHFTEYKISVLEFMVFSDVWGNKDEHAFHHNTRHFLRTLLNEGDWKNGYFACDYDSYFNCEGDRTIYYSSEEGIIFNCTGRQTVYYSSEKGIFYDSTANKYLIIDEEDRVTLNEYFGYVLPYK